MIAAYVYMFFACAVMALAIWNLVKDELLAGSFLLAIGVAMLAQGTVLFP